MIRINLLPVKRRKKAKPVPTFAIVGVFILVGAAIVAFYAMQFMNNKIETLDAQKSANEKEIKKLAETLKEVDGFEGRNKTFTERKNIIEQLTQYQSMPAKILDEMSIRLSDGVWISSMSIIKNKIEFSGTGFSTTDIVTYVQNLKGSEYFKNVVLHETRASRAGAVDTFSFKISLTLAV
jgi:type IV pilus assembly protein PilN